MDNDEAYGSVGARPRSFRLLDVLAFSFGACGRRAIVDR